MALKRWATRQLQTGDLSALQDLKSGRPIASRSRVERLRGRGFVEGALDGLHITILGRVALIAKRMMIN